MVGRDVLFGVLLGIVHVGLFTLFDYLSLRIGSPKFAFFSLSQLSGFRAFSNLIAVELFDKVQGALILFLTLFLLRALLKRQWLAAVTWVTAYTVLNVAFSNPGPYPAYLYVALLRTLLYSAVVFIMLRFGFFALVVMLFVIDSFVGTFFTTDFSAWYGQSSLAVVILVSAMALWGFRLALAGRPLFAPAALAYPEGVQRPMA